MMRKPSEHHAGCNDHGKAEDDIARVVRHVRPVGATGAVVTRDTDADQHERREHAHHTTEDQQPAVVVHVGSLDPGPAASMTYVLGDTPPGPESDGCPICCSSVVKASPEAASCHSTVRRNVDCSRHSDDREQAPSGGRCGVSGRHRREPLGHDLGSQRGELRDNACCSWGRQLSRAQERASARPALRSGEPNASPRHAARFNVKSLITLLPFRGGFRSSLSPHLGCMALSTVFLLTPKLLQCPWSMEAFPGLASPSAKPAGSRPLSDHGVALPSGVLQKPDSAEVCRPCSRAGLLDRCEFHHIRYEAPTALAKCCGPNRFLRARAAHNRSSRSP